MADVTVKQLAQVVGIPVERLLNQLQEAGLSFTDDHQTVNEDQKRLLLDRASFAQSNALSGTSISHRNPGRISCVSAPLDLLHDCPRDTSRFLWRGRPCIAARTSWLA